MSRLLYILICIDLCFSYNFIDNYNKYVKKHIGDRKGIPERNRESRVVFDVAEFMKTEKSSDFDLNAFDEKDSEFGHIQSNYDYSGLINDITGNSDEYGYLNVKDSEIDRNLKDLLSLEESNKDDDSEFVKKHVSEENQNDILNTGNLHDNNKKCMFKKLRVPFFSHSTATSKSRQAKKKKLCMNCNKNVKKEAKDANSTLEKTKRLSASKSQSHNSLFKKFLGHKKTKEKVIHNCRQYYENKGQLTENPDALNDLPQSTKQFTTQKGKANVDYIGETEYSVSNKRIHRAESNEEKERRLKLVDALQKKIEKTQIMPPMFPKKYTSTIPTIILK